MGWTGKTFGPNDRYSVQRSLGEGTLGMTLEAVDLQTNQRVVLKVVELAGDAALETRVRTEVASQAALHHPGLALFEGVAELPGYVALVRRLIPGHNLAQWRLAVGEIDPARAWRQLDPLLQALGTSHHRGMAHLGVCPENVFVSNDGAVSLVDLGLARIVGFARYGTLYAASPFLAPEQRGTHASPDLRADVYALGVLLRTLLTGEGLSRKRGRAGAGHESRHEDIERLVHRTLANDPTRRPADALAFREELAFTVGFTDQTSRMLGAHDAAADDTGDAIELGTSEILAGLQSIDYAQQRPAIASTPPPLPKSVTGEHRIAPAQMPDLIEEPTQPSPHPPVSSAAEAPDNTPTPLPDGDSWFPSLSPKRPTWETDAVEEDSHTEHGTLAGLPGGLQFQPNQTLRLQLPMPTELDDDEPTAVTPAPQPPSSGTIRMRVPPVAEEEPPAPSPDEFPKVGADDADDAHDHTVRMMVPHYDEVDAEPATPDMSDEAAEPEPDVPDEPESIEFDLTPAAAKNVDSTMVMPVGRPAVVHTDSHTVPKGDAEPLQDKPPSPSPSVVLDNPVERLYRPETSDFEAAAELGAQGALSDAPGPKPKAPITRTTPAMRSERSGIGLALAFLIGGLVLGAAGGYVLGQQVGGERAPSTIVAPEADSDDSTHHGVEPTPATAETPSDESASGSPGTGDGTTPTETTEEPVAGNETTTDGSPLAVQPTDGATAGTGATRDPIAMFMPIAENTTPRATTSGLLTFRPDLWQPGNQWILRYHREVPPEEPAYQTLDYFYRRRVEAVEPHPWGRLVTIVDEGGVTAPVQTQFVVTASCVMEPESGPISFCLPFDDTGLPREHVAGLDTVVLAEGDEAASLRYSPDLGWVTLSLQDRSGRIETSELVGYDFGDRRGGDADRATPTCDWNASYERGERVGHAQRDDDNPEMQAADQWGLTGRIRRVDVALNGPQDASVLRAWYDESRTAYMFVAPPVGEEEAPVVDPDADVETVDLVVDEIKTFLGPGGEIEYVALIFEGEDDTRQVRLLTLRAPDDVDTQDLLPARSDDDARLSVVLLANPEGCYVQLRYGEWDATQYANYDLGPDGAAASGGDLGIE